MVLLIGLVLTFLGLILASSGFFGRFPDSWEWVGILIALVGLVVATPSFLQMFWGRPMLNVKFNNGVEETARYLNIFLTNPQIKSKLLKTLHVHRDAIQSLTAQFRISELGSGKIVISSRQPLIYSDDVPNDEGRHRIVLPPTFSVGATIMIAVWETQKNEVRIPKDRLREASTLSEGVYTVQLTFIIDGDPHSISRQFIIGKKADDLRWIMAK